MGFKLSMRINSVASNAFTGYKNIVSSTVVDENRICYMAMELNNDCEKDLDKWIEIQKDLLKIKEPSKYLIFNTSLRPPNGHSYEARSFQAIGPNEFVLNLNVQKQLPLTLKAYTFLASLTKRISQEDAPPKDEKLNLVVDELRKFIIKNYSAEFAQELVNDTKENLIDYSITAGLVNKQIDKNLKTYFTKVG